jgi:hypothetical protein
MSHHDKKTKKSPTHPLESQYKALSIHELDLAYDRSFALTWTVGVTTFTASW